MAAAVLEAVDGARGLIGVVAAEDVGVRMLKLGPGAVAWNVGRFRAEIRGGGGGIAMEMVEEPSRQRKGGKKE